MKTQIQKQIEEAVKEFDKEFVIYVDEDGFDGEFIYNGCPAGDIKKWFKKYANLIATKSAEESIKNWYFEGDELVITKGKWVIDRYKRNNYETSK